MIESLVLAVLGGALGASLGLADYLRLSKAGAAETANTEARKLFCFLRQNFS